MVSLELFRLLYVRVRAGRQTMFLFATAMVIFGLITTVRTALSTVTS